MAFPTAVNGQVTDSVTQTNVHVLGNAPGMSLANFYQTTVQALGNASHNTTQNQQQMNIAAQAVATTGASMIYAIETSSAATS